MRSQGVAGVRPFCFDSLEANGIVASLQECPQHCRYNSDMSPSVQNYVHSCDCIHSRKDQLTVSATMHSIVVGSAEGAGGERGWEGVASGW